MSDRIVNVLHLESDPLRIQDDSGMQLHKQAGVTVQPPQHAILVLEGTKP